MASTERSSIQHLTATLEGFSAGSVSVGEAQMLIAQWIKPVAALVTSQAISSTRCFSTDYFKSAALRA